MTRHITDQPKPPINSKRAAAFMRVSRMSDGKTPGRQKLERPRPCGNGRLVHYLKIERGHEV